MLVKLAALGALGYVGYKYARKAQAEQRAGGTLEVALAGGPLSSDARVQPTPAAPTSL